MTGQPPPINPSLTNSLAASLGRLSARLDSLGLNVRDSSKSFMSTTKEFMAWDIAGSIAQGLKAYNPLANIVQAFQLAEKNQIKAAAMNINSAKAFEVFKTYERSIGSPMEMLGLQLDNYSAGIRQSSVGLDSLQERMRLTGQDTKLATDVSLRMLELTGNNIDSVDKLAAANDRLRVDYNVSNEKLLNAIRGVAKLEKAFVMTGQGGEVGLLRQELEGMLSGRGSNELNQVFELYFGAGSDYRRMQSMLGINMNKFLDSSIPLQQRATMLADDMVRAQNRMRTSIVTSNNASYAQDQLIGAGIQGFGQELTIVSNLLKEAGKNDIKMASTNEEAFKTKLSIDEMATRFYQYYVPDMHQFLMTMANAAGPASIGGAVFGASLVPMLGRALPMIGTAMGGPIGTAIGAALGFGITQLFQTEPEGQKKLRMQQEEEAKRRKQDADKQSQLLRDIRDKDKVLPSINSMQSEYLQRALNVTLTGRPDDMKTQNDLLQQIVSLTKQGLAPSNKPSKATNP